MSIGKKVPEQPAEPEHRDSAMIKWGLELQRELSQTVAGVLVRGARAVPVGTADGGTTRPATSGANSLMGFALMNTHESDACAVELLDGDLVLMTVQLGPLESTREFFGLSGIGLSQGLTYSDPDGLTKGCVFLRGSDY